MAKEDIFSKINLKDYNNILENVLEQKAFSEDVKNLLLSMLYKIENGYEDYKTIKVNVSSKKNYVKKIIEVIKEECKEIKLVKPLSDESKVLEEKNVNYIVEKEKGKITVYPNERMMLEALIEPAMMIVDAVHSVLERTPPELAADISDRGIYMTGGGCLIDGLDKLLQEKTGINVMIAQDTVSCVALGTGKALENLDALDGKAKR